MPASNSLSIELVSQRTDQDSRFHDLSRSCIGDGKRTWALHGHLMPLSHADVTFYPYTHISHTGANEMWAFSSLGGSGGGHGR